MAFQSLAPEKLLKALQDFANTQTDVASQKYFLKRWPGFLEKPIETFTKTQNAMGPIERVIMDMQHRQSGAEKWEPFDDARGYVRLAWKGNEGAIALLLHLGMERVNIVLVDWRLGGFRYIPRTNLQAAVYELLKNSKKARVCPNPDCPAPYFLTDDHRTKFCGRKECERPSILKTKRNSFHRHKKEWRKPQSKRKGK